MLETRDDKSLQPTGVKPETAEPKQGKHSISWGWIVWPGVVLIFYLLSAGPVALIRYKHALADQENLVLDGSSFAEKFYAPWGWAYAHTPLRKPLGMYMHIWVPEVYKKDGELTLQL